MSTALGGHRRIRRAEGCDQKALMQGELSPELLSMGLLSSTALGSEALGGAFALLFQVFYKS